MKKIVKRTLVSFLIFIFSVAPISPQAILNFSQIKFAQAEVNIKNINLNNITENVRIPEGTKFIIEKGTTVNFNNQYVDFIIEGELEINGTKDEPVIIKRSNYMSSFSIITKPSSKVTINNAIIDGGGYSLISPAKGLSTKALASYYAGAIQNKGGNTTITNTTFENNLTAFVSDDEFEGNLRVNGCKFINNKYDVEDYNESNFKFNYWQNFQNTTNCADNPSVDICLPKSAGNFDFSNWQTNINFVYVDGTSSVLFLPGIQSSRLYEKAGELEFRLWEPGDSVEDLQRLYLDKNGDSISDGIYTKDILDEVYGFNIYKKFMSYMDGLVSDNTIKEWKAVPYDWRLPLEDIVDGKIKLENSEMDIIDELETLASESNTGKVTIIGHSNGGLLGKVLIDRLKTLGKANLVDKFIMVATPQAGTPKALVGLLHGDKLDIPGTMLDRNRARDLSENMSSAYNLLPSKKYFDYVTTPVVEFEDDVKDIYDFEEIYGDKINNKEDLDKFLTGDDGKRLDPDYTDTDSPNVLSKNLLSKANNIHDNLLDNWSAPENVEVIQIAGWGLDTIVGIKYDDCDVVFCSDELSNLDRELIFKKDGDATVVIPSATIMNDGEIYYVNINEYNKGLTKDRDHASILEIPNLQEFIKNILNNKRDLLTYITTLKPGVSDEDKSLRYRMHSPVAVHLYDESNNHTGLAENPNSKSDLIYYEEKIPNSYYIEFGETKYLGSPKDGITRVELIGEDTGTFTFEIDELSGNNVDKTTVFKDVPVIKDMRADIDISQNIGIMEIDWNNDDNIDATIDVGKPNSSEVVSIQLLKEVIKSSSINPILKNHFLNEIKVAEKQIKKGKNKNAGKILEILERQIEIFSDKKMFKKLRIDKVEAENLIKIIETIRLNLIK